MALLRLQLPQTNFRPPTGNLPKLSRHQVLLALDRFIVPAVSFYHEM